MVQVKTLRKFAYSPLRYPGGKSSLFGFFCNIFDKNNWTDFTYIEPYAGGAGSALALLLTGKVGSIIINDYDVAIYSFWKAIIDHPADFISKIRNTPITIEEWRKQKEIYNNKDKSILTTKLLLGSDGRKMSKTYNNFVAIEDAPNDMFGKIMSMSDNLIDEYLELATRLSVKEIKETKKLSNPRDQKARLAREIVKMYHEEKEAVKAEEEFNKIFRNKELPSDMPIFEVTENNYAILDLMLDAKLAVSKNEAKRLVEQNAVEIIIGDKKQKIIDWKAEVNIEDGMIIKVGNRRFVKIIKK